MLIAPSIPSSTGSIIIQNSGWLWFATPLHRPVWWSTRSSAEFSGVNRASDFLSSDDILFGFYDLLTDNIADAENCPMLCFLARSYFWYELLLPDGTSPSALFCRRRSPRIIQSCGGDSAPHPASAQPAG